MATVTKPVMLDETGQAIVQRLNQISLLPHIVDNLTTQDSGKALSAKQGYVLDQKKYDTPQNGIPKEDMASSVKTSLGLADTAYQRPNSGIPAASMASAVQTSLGLADTSVQRTDIYDGLDSSSASLVLSAKQGYILNNDKLSISSTGPQTMNSDLSVPNLTASGTVTANTFSATSSRKLKENIEPAVCSALDIISKTDIVNFNYINDDEKTPHIGFIAEDTPTILSTPHHNRMDYTNCIGVLMKAVQEIAQQLNELKEKVEGGEDASRDDN